MIGKALELHGATFGDGEAAGGNDECACAAIRGYYAGVRVLSQRGKLSPPPPRSSVPSTKYLVSCQAALTGMNAG